MILVSSQADMVNCEYLDIVWILSKVVMEGNQNTQLVGQMI